MISIYAMTICAFVANGSILNCRLRDVIRSMRVGWIILSASLPGAGIFLLGRFVSGGALIRLFVLGSAFAIMLIAAYHIMGVVSLRRVVAAVSRRLAPRETDTEDLEK